MLKAREVYSVVATLEPTVFNSSLDSCICGFLFMSNTVCHLGTLGDVLCLKSAAPAAHLQNLGYVPVVEGSRREMTALVLCLSWDPG